VAVRLSETVGRDLVRTVATEFGIQSDLADGPALALGASESSLLEMTGRLFRHPERRLGGSALRPAGGAHRRATSAAAGAAHGGMGIA
jgi:penicillin-binding protein 1A